MQHLSSPQPTLPTALLVLIPHPIRAKILVHWQVVGRDRESLRSGLKRHHIIFISSQQLNLPSHRHLSKSTVTWPTRQLQRKRRVSHWKSFLLLLTIRMTPTITITTPLPSRPKVVPHNLIKINPFHSAHPVASVKKKRHWHHHGPGIRPIRRRVLVLLHHHLVLGL